MAILSIPVDEPFEFDTDILPDKVYRQVIVAGVKALYEAGELDAIGSVETVEQPAVKSRQFVYRC